MKNIKILRLLSSFSPAEIEEFDKYLNSPFFNSSNKLKALYGILKKHYPDFYNEKLTKPSLFGQLYPNENYNDKKLRDCFSILLKLAEDYLGLIEIRNRPELLKRLSLKQLGERRFDTIFESKSKEIKRLLEKSKYMNTRYYYTRHLLEKDNRNFHESKTPLGKRNIFLDQFNKEMEYFVIYFILKMLKYYLITIEDEKFFQYRSKLTKLNIVLAYIKEKSFDKIPILKIYKDLILLLSGRTKENIYYRTKESIYENISSIDQEDLRFLFKQLFYYTKQKSLKGRADFRKENFLIVREMLELNIYPLEEKHMPEHVFLDIVSSGIVEREYKWAEDFINSYKNMVTPERRECAYAYCISLLDFVKGDFKKSLDDLSRVKDGDYNYHINIREQILKIFYELNETINIYSVLNSYKHYLDTNKTIPESISLSHKNFVKIFMKLMKAKTNGDGLDYSRLKRLIERQSEIANKEWLVEKVSCCSLQQ